MTGPTAAQLRRRELVAVTPPLVNGQAPTLLDPIHHNFPPIQTVYVTPVVTPPPPPPPPPGTGPSGIAVPPVASGFTRAGFDDFTSTTLGSLVRCLQRAIKRCTTGDIPRDNLVLQGDSLLRLEAYSDPNWANSWESTQAIATSVNNVCGAGVQTGTRWPVGTTFTWTCKWDTCPGLDADSSDDGQHLAPGTGLIEANVSVAGAPQTGYTSSYLYAPGPTQEQVPVNLPHGVADFAQWHLWQLKWTASGSTLTCDGAQVVNVSFSNAMVSGVNGPRTSSSSRCSTRP